MFKSRSMEELRKIQKVLIYVVIPFLLLALFIWAKVNTLQKQKSVPNHEGTIVVVLAIE